MLFLDRTLPTIEEDLALDEALLVEAEEGRLGPLVRVWERPTPAVVLGASGRLHEDVITEACLADGVPIARRSSGGGTVVVGPGALNFAVVLPRDFAPGLDAVDRAQAFVLGRLASELRGRGVPAEVLGSGDLTVARRKVSGSAQRRLKGYFLVHATVLRDFPLGLIARYTRQPDRQPAYREGRSHDDFVANLGVARMDLVTALRAAWGIPPVAVTPEVPMSAVASLVSSKFGDPAWVARL